jgi:hypothetical protein
VRHSDVVQRASATTAAVQCGFICGMTQGLDSFRLMNVLGRSQRPSVLTASYDDSRPTMARRAGALLGVKQSIAGRPIHWLAINH